MTIKLFNNILTNGNKIKATTYLNSRARETRANKICSPTKTVNVLPIRSLRVWFDLNMNLNVPSISVSRLMKHY